MSNHTPGPWNYDSGYIDTHRVEDDGSSDYLILAEMRSTFGYDDYGVHKWMLPPEEYEANARLIAAAPEMFELISGLSQAYDDRQSGHELAFRLYDLRCAALRLLAKIEGGEA